eukprot:7157669-Alexandrium_andersonii.AAC.1
MCVLNGGKDGYQRASFLLPARLELSSTIAPEPWGSCGIRGKRNCHEPAGPQVGSDGRVRRCAAQGRGRGALGRDYALPSPSA